MIARKTIALLVGTAMAGTLALTVGSAAQAAETSGDASTIQVGPKWYDTDGNLVEAHGGAANLYHESEVNYDINGDGDKNDNIYMFYGEKKTNATRPVDGVNGYWSEDLVNWHYMGNVLKTSLFLPAKTVTVEKDGQYTDVDFSQPKTGTKYAVPDEDNLNRLKEFANYSEAEAKAKGVENEAANAKAFVAAYVTQRDANGKATAYDEDSLAIAFQYLYGMYNVIERPKTVYNAKTKKWVIIFHSDSSTNGNSKLTSWLDACRADASFTKTGTCDTKAHGYSGASRYSRGMLGFAESDSPFGPFKMVNATRANWDSTTPKTPGMARDMTVFVDTQDKNNDGVNDAYAVYSSENNDRMYVSRLNTSYTDTEVRYNEKPAGEGWQKQVLPDWSREASSVFYWDGYYYMLTSGLAGWGSSEVKFYRAKDMLQAKWEKVSNPFPSGQTNGYDSQPTYVLAKDQAKGQFIYMGDRWYTASNGSAGNNSRLIWLPVTLTNDASKPIAITGRSSWDPNDASLYRQISPAASITATVVEGDDDALAKQLPTTVDVKVGGQDKTVTSQVSWNAESIHAAALLAGESTVTGTLTFNGDLSAYNGTTITANVTVTEAANRVETTIGDWNVNIKPVSTVEIDGRAYTVAWDSASLKVARAATAFTETAIVGTTDDGTRVVAKANVVPGDMQYTIDSGREGADSVFSTAYKGALNGDVSDQQWDGKTVGKTWGYSSEAGIVKAGSADDWASSYVGANFNKPVTYHLTLPAGEYRIGTEQTPRSGGTTKIYSTASVDGKVVAERKTADSSDTSNTLIEQTVTLDKESVVDVEFGTNATAGWNARLGRIWVAKVTHADTSKLQAAIDDVSALKESDYTADSWKTFAAALAAAQTIAADTSAYQEDVDAALDALTEARNGLKSAAATDPGQSGTDTPDTPGTNGNGSTDGNGSGSGNTATPNGVVQSNGNKTVTKAEDKKSTLSRTGSNVAAIAVLAFAMLSVGVAGVMTVRRRG